MNWIFFFLFNYFWLCWVFVAAQAFLYFWCTESLLRQHLSLHSTRSGRVGFAALQHVGSSWTRD